MAPPNLFHHPFEVDCQVKINGVYRWKEASSDPYVVAREELQSMNGHPPIETVSKERLWIIQKTYFCAKVTFLLSANSPIIRGSLDFILEVQMAAIIL